VQLKDIGPFGTTGMAGNVREWAWNEVEGRHYALGGAWNDPLYMAVDDDARPAEDRSDTNGFRCITETAPSAPAVYAAGTANRDLEYAKQKPVDDATFTVFRRFYAYEPLPLDAKLKRPSMQATSGASVSRSPPRMPASVSWRTS